MRIFFCFIFTSLIYSQINSFQLEKLNRINQEKLFVKNSTIASTIFLPTHIVSNKNIALSSFFISGNKNSDFDLTPVLIGSIKLSWNLSLLGRMSASSNEKKAINIYGWGLSYKPGSEDRKSSWNIGINSGVYKHFNSISSSSFSFSFMRKIYLRKSNVFLGISSNNVKGVNYNINQNIDSQDFKYNFSNFIFGTTIKLKGIKILPILNYSTDNLVVIVGLQKEF